MTDKITLLKQYHQQSMKNKYLELYYYSYVHSSWIMIDERTEFLEDGLVNTFDADLEIDDDDTEGKDSFVTQFVAYDTIDYFRLCELNGKKNRDKVKHFQKMYDL